MSGTAKKTDPKLWEKVKKEVTQSSKGGKPGQWSARKAQMATSEYKKEGGGYAGRKSDDNHLKQWTEEEWGTKSGEASGKTGERYLPEKAREKLSDSEYRRSTAKKRADSAKGKQHSKQPADVAKKAASARETGGKSGTTSPKGGAKGSVKGSAKKGSGGTTRAELMRRARKQDIPGRSKMTKDELERALAS